MCRYCLESHVAVVEVSARVLWFRMNFIVEIVVRCYRPLRCGWSAICEWSDPLAETMPMLELVSTCD
jgi:hypothetical protein